jgi:aprataxin
MPSPPPPSSSSIPQLKILRAYAKLDDASLAAAHLPPTIYFSHTRHTLTIFDAYPKALFHFLVLPRLRLPPAQDINGDGGRESDSPPLMVTESAEDLTSLRTLLQRATASGGADADARARAEGTLGVLADEARRLQSEIEREMRTHYRFTWPIWVGFHAVPSME